MEKLSIARTSPATVVMTATICPANGMPGSQRNDPAVRLDDYLGAFRFYLSLDDQIVDQIIVLENSDADLSVFSSLAHKLGSMKRVHAINTSSDYDGRRGKGYGEFMMMDAGLRTLSDARLISQGTPIWKLTGRLICSNLSKMVEKAPPNYSVYCDLRSLPMIGDRLGGNHWMDLRIFSCSLAAYDRYFRGQYDVPGGIEKVFFSITRAAIDRDPDIVPRFRVQPVIHGFGGFDNRDYRSASYRAKDLLRRTTRLVAPFVWL